MRHALVALAALAFAGAARADTFIPVGQGQSPTFVVVPTPTPTQATAAPTPADGQTSTADLQSLWMGAGAAYGIPWQVLAAINELRRSKGLAESRVVGVHVLRNVLVPIVAVTGVQFGSVIAFAVVTETIFAWPGMGKLLIDSINVLDRPVIVGYLCIVVVLFVAINLVVDLLTGWLDPRVRLGGQA